MNQLITEFDTINPARKERLSQLATLVEQRLHAEQTVHLNFICTHNSRRSQISQLWAQAAAHYYSIPDVQCYSGGTEVTAFNPRAVQAMRNAGFQVTQVTMGENPVYQAIFAKDINPVTMFSKTYDSPFNHHDDFVAIMACSHADEKCPLVFGATERIALTYNDPKEFDDDIQEERKYKECVCQIASEILYAFSRVNMDRH